MVQFFKKIYLFILLIGAALGIVIYYGVSYYFSGQSSYISSTLEVDLAGKSPLTPSTAFDSSRESFFKRGAHRGAFRSQGSEQPLVALTIQGTLPSWLHGDFLAIGPSVFEIEESKAKHWLDGFGMIHKFAINNNKITYANRLIKSCYYQEACKKGKICGSVPEKPQSTWSKLTSALSSSTERPVYDNTNVNLATFNNELVALTESPCHYCIDPATLSTKNKFNYTDTVQAHFSCAHPLYDSQTHEWYGIAINYAHTSTYIAYKMKENSATREIIAQIPVSYPAYIHSFALTPHYIIIIEPPFVVSPYDLLLNDKSFIEAFQWKPKQGTKFIVIHRETGKIKGTYKTDAFFSLHQVNAFEHNDLIHIDLVAYNDPSLIKSFYLNNIHSNALYMPASQVKRYTVNLLLHAVIPPKTLTNTSLELPHINMHYFMKKYRYLYATASDTTEEFAGNLIKVDIETHAIKRWSADNCYPTEPIFVPTPSATAEDDGIILSLVFDGNNNKSFIVVIDAKTFKERARAYTPRHIPFTVHSKFLPQ